MLDSPTAWLRPANRDLNQSHKSMFSHPYIAPRQLDCRANAHTQTNCARKAARERKGLGEILNNLIPTGLLTT